MTRAQPIGPTYSGRTPIADPEATPAKAKGRPRCPKSITGEARKEWDRVCSELADLELLSTTDRAILVLYCKAWARWTAAQAKVDELGLLVAAPKTRTPMSNPWLAITNKSHEQCAKLLIELGLTAASRTRMRKGAKEAEPDTGELDF